MVCPHFLLNFSEGGSLVHPSIVNCLSRVKSRGKQFQQRAPNVPFPGHNNQLWCRVYLLQSHYFKYTTSSSGAECWAFNMHSFGATRWRSILEIVALQQVYSTLRNGHCVLPPPVPGSATRSPPSWTCLEDLPRVASWHPYQVRESPQLAAFYAKKLRLYSESLLDDWTNLNLKGNASHVPEKTHFGPLYLVMTM